MIAGCADFEARKEDKQRQPSRDSSAALDDAKAGKPEGLHSAFAAAHSQVMLPCVNGGEDAEAIATNLQTILEAVGDDTFSEALLKERSKTRSAVRDCMFENVVRQRFPRTHQILREGPLVRWPSCIAYERSWTSIGQTPPPKKIWRP